MSLNFVTFFSGELCENGIAECSGLGLSRQTAWQRDVIRGSGSC